MREQIHPGTESVSGPGFARGPFAAGGEAGGPSRPVGAALPLLRRAARFFLPYQGRLVLIGGLIVASSVIGLANPYLLKLMIDDAFPKRDIGLDRKSTRLNSSH